MVFWNPPAHKSHRYISRYPEIFEKKSRLIDRKTACCETSKLVSEWTCELWTVAELEDEEEHVINWSVEMTDVLGSRLYALWNRTAGDCLLDSVLQASWGVMDRDNTLRRALADSLNEAAFTYAPSPYHTHTHTHTCHFNGCFSGNLGWLVMAALCNSCLLYTSDAADDLHW